MKGYLYFAFLLLHFFSGKLKNKTPAVFQSNFKHKPPYLVLVDNVPKFGFSLDPKEANLNRHDLIYALVIFNHGPSPGEQREL